MCAESGFRDSKENAINGVLMMERLSIKEGGDKLLEHGQQTRLCEKLFADLCLLSHTAALTIVNYQVQGHGS